MTGNIDTIWTKHSDDAAVESEILGYDKLHQLTHWHLGSQGASTLLDEDFQYDRAGNITSLKVAASPGTVAHTYWPGTNRLKKIGTSADYTYDASGHIASEPGRSFGPEYRNITAHVTIPKGNWNNYLDFWYDADLQRIKKHVDAGYGCACDEQNVIDPTDPDRLNLEPPDATTPWLRSEGVASDLRNLSASAKSGVNPRVPSFPEEIEDSTVIRVSGIGGDSCICRTATTILYIHSYDGRVVREYVNGVAQRDYLYAGSNRIGVSEKTGSTYKLRYFLTDHLGSTRQTIDSTGLMESRLDS